MAVRLRRRAAVVATCLGVLIGGALAAHESLIASQEERMQGAIARGSFEVTLTPLPVDSALGRMAIVKRFRGDLRGTSEGEMLTWSPDESASAAYVALERVDGVLGGRSGSFVLQHTGTMTADERRLSIAVVPGSATGALAGLRGTLAIEITDGKHLYEFAYELPDRP